jgi:serine/threonine protein kinase
MAALKVPFEAGTLPDLYKKITQGIINKIPSGYSDDLYSVIKLCLKVDPKQRPSVDELIKNPLIQARVKLLKKDFETEQKELNRLMATIKFEKKLNKVNINLPTTRKYRQSSADLGKIKEALGAVVKENAPKTTSPWRPTPRPPASKCSRRPRRSRPTRTTSPTRSATPPEAPSPGPATTLPTPRPEATP